MSLVKTLAKVAIGVAIAKGVSHVAQNGLPGGAAQPGRGSRTGGAGDLLGQLGGMLGGNTGSSRTAGGGDLLGQLGGMLGGGGSRGGAAGGGLGGLLDSLGGGAAAERPATRRSNAPSGLDAILGGAGAGGLGGLLGGLLGGAGNGGSIGGIGGLLNQALAGGGEPATAPSRDQELAAALMLRAMIQAAKADGALDAEEKSRLMHALDGASAEEIAFVNAELQGPVDIDALAAQVPQGLEAQVYAISLAAIDLDNRQEAEYLHGLAQALALDPAEVNDIHDSAGAPKLYS